MERLRALVFQHVDNEHLGYMAPALENEGVDIHVINFSRMPDDLKIKYYPVETVDMLIVLGGPMGVNNSTNEYPSKEVELATIKRAIFEARVPTFGVCLGSQLIAKALGAEVYQNKKYGKRIKEIGYYGVPLTKTGFKDPIFSGLDSPLSVLQWHGDAFELPKGAKRLATSLNCTNQAFVYNQDGALAYGVLFHTEFTPEMVRQQIINDREWIHDVEDPRDDVNEEFIIECADKNASLMEKETRIIVRNWVNMVRARTLTKVI